MLLTVSLSSEENAFSDSVFCLGAPCVNQRAVLDAMLKAGMEELKRQHRDIQFMSPIWGKKNDRR